MITQELEYFKPIIKHHAHKLPASYQDDFEQEAYIKVICLSDRGRNYVSMCLRNLWVDMYRIYAIKRERESISNVLINITKPAIQTTTIITDDERIKRLAFFYEYSPAFRESLFDCTSREQIRQIIFEWFGFIPKTLRIVKQLLRGGVIEHGIDAPPIPHDLPNLPDAVAQIYQDIIMSVYSVRAIQRRYGDFLGYIERYIHLAEKDGYITIKE